MRKLNLKNYTVKMQVPDNMNPGQKIDVEFPYHMKDQTVNILFIRELGLNGVELVKANILAQKIMACEDGEILLDDAEWQRLKTAIDTFRGFGRPDVEFIHRINESKVVEVEEKK